MKNKKIIALILIFIMTLFAGCNKTPESISTETEEISEIISENTEELTIEPPTTEHEENKQNDKYADNEAYKVAMKFIANLQNKDFIAVNDLIALYNNSVIADEHLTEILKGSEWKDLIGVKGEYILISFDQRYEDRKILTFKMDSVQYDLPLVLDNGKWKVSLSKYIVDNFQFVVPWEVKVYWDGVELDRAKYSTVINTGNTMLDLYTVTCTPTKVTFKFTSDAYGDFVRQITPRHLTEPYELDRNFDKAQTDVVINGIQTMWNEMFTDYINNMPAEEWCYKHFAYRTTPEEEMAVYNQIKDYLGNNKYLKVEMIDIKQWDGYFSGISMNRIATANFSYKLKMLIAQPPIEIQETQPDGTIITKTVEQEPIEKISEEIFSNIRVERAAHGYIIFELTDPDLFNDKSTPLET